MNPPKHDGFGLCVRIVTLLIAAGPVASLTAQDTPGDGGRRAIPTRFFAPLIGSWTLPDSALPPDSPLRGRYATLAWGPDQRAVMFFEGHLPGRFETAILSGIAAWDPATSRVQFFAYNNQSDFLFLGAYTEIREGYLAREYEVRYPPDHEYAKSGNSVIQFRESYTPDGPDRLLTTLEYFNKRDGIWSPWGSGRGVLLRVRP